MKARIWQAAALLALSATGISAAPEPGSAVHSAEALQLRARIRTDALAPKAGAAKGDVTVVVFSDYQCPYCRTFNRTLSALLTADPRVTVVYRDWPLQGPASVLAARAAIAAQYQNRHGAFHAALMAGPVRLDTETIKLAARKAGIDWDRLQADMTAHKSEIDALLVRNFQYADIMGLQGTPGAMIGARIVPGAVDLATLRQTVETARKSGAL